MHFHALTTPGVLLGSGDVRNAVLPTTLPTDTTAWDDAILADLGFVRAPARSAVEPWQTVTWGQGEWLVADRPLDAVKAERLSALAARRYQAECGGTSLNGMPLASDRETQAKLIAVRIKAKENPAYTVNWKAPGGFISLDAATVIAVSDQVAAHVQACFDHEAGLTLLIEGANTPAAVLAVDIDTGWP
jgi:hypothetical protein